MIDLWVDIHLDSSSTHAGASLSQSPSLSFLAVIHTSDVPLYLAAGPALDVWTDDPHTEEVLTGLLLPSRDICAAANYAPKPWWLGPSQQSDLGVLVKVKGSQAKEAVAQAPQATEILLYAAVVGTHHIEGLLTPPRSSSPVADAPRRETQRNGSDTQLRLFALPLCSNVTSAGDLTRHHEVQEQSVNPGRACFLPQGEFIAAPSQNTSKSKRRKISNVFEDATKQRRKLKGRGGEAISRAMADALPTSALPPMPQTSQAYQSQEILPSKATHESAQASEMRRRSLSRASSAGSIHNIEPSRPPSRRDSFIPGKRSGLNRVESVVSGPDSPLTLDSDNSLQDHNTKALSRIVMTGMRMYGLQQKKRVAKYDGQGTEENDNPDSQSNSAQRDLDEYKLVYHQTYKGACFAFRNHFPNALVSPEQMREVVDRLLLLFCTDPLSTSSTDSQGDQLFGSQGDVAQSRFDMPSNKILENAVAVTPSSRKSKHGVRNLGPT